MPNNHLVGNRKSTRLDDFDYSQSGAFFVTIVTLKRACLFGGIRSEEIELSPFGDIAHREWFKSEYIRKEIELHQDEFCVMPNHIHGIVWIVTDSNEFDVRAHGRAPLRDNYKKLHRNPRSLSSFIAGYKSSVTRQINQLRNTPGQPVWMRNYHDRIIRNERELNAFREYIWNNPLNWNLDRENPKHHEPINHP